MPIALKSRSKDLHTYCSGPLHSDETIIDLWGLESKGLFLMRLTSILRYTITARVTRPMSHASSSSIILLFMRERPPAFENNSAEMAATDLHVKHWLTETGRSNKNKSCSALSCPPTLWPRVRQRALNHQWCRKPFNPKCHVHVQGHVITTDSAFYIYLVFSI